MTIEKALFELIKASAGVSSRIYALRAPQNAVAPFVIFQRTNADRWRAINNPSGVVQAEYQVDVYAGEYYQAKQIASLIEIALDGFRGEVEYGQNSPRDSIKIGGITLQNDLDIIDETAPPILMRNAATYVITYHQGM